MRIDFVRKNAQQTGTVSHSAGTGRVRTTLSFWSELQTFGDRVKNEELDKLCKFSDRRKKVIDKAWIFFYSEAKLLQCRTAGRM